MKKDKLITVRVNEQIRDKFNQWCAEQGLSASEFLSNIIEDCASGDYEMSSNNKNKSNKIARQKVIALEAKFEEMSSHLASVIPTAQAESVVQIADEEVREKISFLESQIALISNNHHHQNNLSNSIDNVIDKGEIERFVETKVDSLLHSASILEKLESVLDVKKVERLLESKVDSFLNPASILKRLDNVLDKYKNDYLRELEGRVDAFLTNECLLKKIEGLIDKKWTNELLSQESLPLTKTANNDYSVAESFVVKDNKSLIGIDDVKNQSEQLSGQEVIQDASQEEVQLTLTDTQDDIKNDSQDQSQDANQEEVQLTLTASESDSENASQELTQYDSGEVTQEAKNDIQDNIQNDTQNAKKAIEISLPLKSNNIPQAFLDLPQGTVSTKDLANSLNLASARISEIAAGKKKTLPFDEFWDYLEVEKDINILDNGKQRILYKWRKKR